MPNDFHKLYNSTREEVFTTGMKVLILASCLASTFGTVVAILTLFMDCQIHEVTTTMARLDNVEMQ